MVDYDFYLNEYRGSSISRENWDAIERDASAKLNQYKRKYTVTAKDEKSESMAVCAMAEALDYFEAVQNGAGTVQSASIGSVSVTYGTPAAGADISPNGREKELFRCACLYLDIYRGVG